MLPTPGLPSADMQLRPFHLSLGPGLMRDIHEGMARHGSYPTFETNMHVTL